MKKNRINRRSFLGSMIAAAVAPQIVPRGVLGGETAPSRKIRLGHIGTGGQGTGLLYNFLSVDDALSAAIADPFKERRESAGAIVKQSQGHDLYIGPAPMKPCSKDRITTAASWFCSDYALGFIAGWGAHPLDVAVWGMDSDTKGPVAFRGSGDFPTPKALFDTCATWDVEIKFGDGVTMHFMSTNHAEAIVKKYQPSFPGDGTTFFGSKGWVSLSRGNGAASNPDWLKLRECEGTKRVLYRNHYYKAFVDAVRDRTASIAPIEDAVRSDALSHLSLLAIKSRGEVVWDPKAYRITSPEALNTQMTCPVRGTEWAATGQVTEPVIRKKYAHEPPGRKP